jgi:hypothetical protein
VFWFSKIVKGLLKVMKGGAAKESTD